MPVILTERERAALPGLIVEAQTSRLHTSMRRMTLWAAAATLIAVWELIVILSRMVG